ncbi:hypothetical protein [Ramlibacter sp.]|uniref:hypothetical protein n=1 Tax=Ramlibacter sp. TaxID=1917967 RepID=UPI00178F4FF0|nr:hypothetical protein [Ramlibacter sp.]MBA2675500.1 hypothetical protein [Ramlibacter sp.]
MSFTLTVEQGLPYIFVVCTGPVSLAELCAAADFVASLAQRRRQQRALLELSGTQPDLSFTDHLQLGTHVAQAFGTLQRVGTVVSQDNRVGTSEKAARKSGLRLRTFTDLETAQKWLLSDDIM